MKQNILKKGLIFALTLTVFLSVFSAATPNRVGAANEHIIRIHFDKGTSIKDELVWTWDYVLTPPTTGFPGDIKILESTDSVYTHYVDLALKENAQKIGFLVVKPNGDKRTDDIAIEIISKDMTDVYLDANFNVHYTKDRVPEGKFRIHYLDKVHNYRRTHMYGYGLLNVNGNNDWGTFLEIDSTNPGKNGAIADFDLSTLGDLADIKTGFFSLVPTSDSDRSHEFVLSEIPESREIFVREGDETIYSNPYYVLQEKMIGAEQVAANEIQLRFNDI